MNSIGRAVTEVAQKLGVSPEPLRGIPAGPIGRGQGRPGELAMEERDELKRLRKLAAEPTRMIEVLLEAAVFFAKE